MTVYALVLLKVTDEEEFKRYSAGVPPTALKYGVQIVAAEEKPAVVEEEWPYNRTLILSLSDSEKMNGWYCSEEYQELVKLRHESSTGQIVVLKGPE